MRRLLVMITGPDSSISLSLLPISQTMPKHPTTMEEYEQHMKESDRPIPEEKDLRLQLAKRRRCDSTADEWLLTFLLRSEEWTEAQRLWVSTLIDRNYTHFDELAALNKREQEAATA